MTNRIRFREVGRVEINGSRCSPIRWSRFSSKQTASTGGRTLYRRLILNNYVSCTVAAPCTHSDIAKRIAMQSLKRIPIESVPNELSKHVFPRGRTIFGFPGDYFDQIARNYVAMWWWVSKKGLAMAVIASSNPKIKEFDGLAGRLMYDARTRRRSNGRLPFSEYRKIATALDKAHFKPIAHLEGRCRVRLADWNQKHPREAIHSFSKAIKVGRTLPAFSFLRRGVQKRLQRAESHWEKLNKLSAH
jgi:hypothetical protein